MTGVASASLREMMARMEARIVQGTVVACGGNKVKAARTLGVSYRALMYKLARYRRMGIAQDGLDKQRVEH